MTRPTIEEIAEAREWFAGDGRRALAHLAANYPESYGAIVTLLAATEPPTDEEIVDFAVEYYERHNLGASSIRTHEKLLALTNSGPSYRVSAMHAVIRHFLGPAKP